MSKFQNPVFWMTVFAISVPTAASIAIGAGLGILAGVVPGFDTTILRSIIGVLLVAVGLSIPVSLRMTVVTSR